MYGEVNHIGSGEEGEKRQQSQREDEVINPLRLKCFFRLESSSDVHTKSDCCDANDDAIPVFG